MWRTLFRVGRKCLLTVAVLLFFPAVLLMRVLRPIILIRVGLLDSSRIGHFGANTELYLCERDAGMHGGGTLDVFYHLPLICNNQLKRMWERKLHVSIAARLAANVNRRLPGYEAHMVPMPSDLDPHGFLGRMPTHLVFTPEEEERGRVGLRALGVPEGAPFVCFHSRDSAYLSGIVPDFDFCYHDYRNTSIQNCIPAAEELVRRGYYLIRMGAVVEEALKAGHPRVIDYATNGSRSDFMDIFLCARCDFFVGAAGGLNAIPRIFRRPIAFTNVVPFGRDHMLSSCGPNNLFIPKKLRVRASGRFMTFREILQSGAGDYSRTEQYVALGIDVLENTPEEITTLVTEMDERLRDTWRTTEDDEHLQGRFWSLVADLRYLCDRQLLRVGAQFLRQNRELLD